jgi:hypothetical protein
MKKVRTDCERKKPKNRERHEKTYLSSFKNKSKEPRQLGIEKKYPPNTSNHDPTM